MAPAPSQARRPPPPPPPPLASGRLRGWGWGGGWGAYPLSPPAVLRYVLYSNDPLWDGQDCRGLERTCCEISRGIKYVIHFSFTIATLPRNLLSTVNMVCTVSYSYSHFYTQKLSTTSRPPSLTISISSGN